MEKYYYDMTCHCIITESGLMKDYEDIKKSDDCTVDSFEEFKNTAIEWQDIVPLSADDLKKLQTEKCYFCADSSEILSESELKKGYEMNAYGMDYDNYEDFISAVTSPWESLTAIN